MSTYISSILKQLGWVKGFRIPIANEENKQLESQVEEKLRSKTTLITTRDNLKNKMDLLKSHSFTILQEKSENQHLLDSLYKQMEFDIATYEELKLEKERWFKDTKIVIKNIDDYTDRKQIHKNDMEKLLSKISGLQTAMEWNEEMKQLLNDFIQQEVRDNVLLRYKREDDSTIRQLEFQRQRLKTELTEYEEALMAKSNELIKCNAEIEKSDKNIQQAIKQKQWIIKQWEHATNILKIRDSEINEMNQNINILRDVIMGEQAKVLQQDDIYKKQVCLHMEATLETKQLELALRKQNETNDIVVKDLEELSNVVTSIDAELTNLKNEIKRDKFLISKLTEDKSFKRKYHSKLVEKVENLKNKLKSIDKQSTSVSDRIEQLKDIESNMARRLVNLHNEILAMDRKMFLTKSEMENLAKEIESVDCEVKLLRNTKSTMQKDISKINEQIIVQNGLLLSMNDKIANVIHQICEMKGEDENSVIMAEERKQQLLEMSKELILKKRELEKLQYEFNHSHNELKRVEEECNKKCETMSTLESKRQLLMNLAEAGEKEYRKITCSAQDLQVEENIMLVHSRNLENIIANEGSKLVKLEKQKVLLENAIIRRKIEIETAIGTLTTVKKQMLDELSETKRKSDQLTKRINQLINKYDIILETSEKDDDGNFVTELNYKMKMVRERFCFLERGDKLEQELQNSEKELAALGNTLQLVTLTNQSFKLHLFQREMDDGHNNSSGEITEDSLMLQEVESQRKVLEEDLIILKGSFLELKRDFQESSKFLENLKMIAENFKKMHRDKEIQAQLLLVNLQDQNDKLVRARNRMKTGQNLLKCSRSNSEVEVIQKDIEVREMLDDNRNGLYQLSKLASQNENIKSTISKCVAEISTSERHPALTTVIPPKSAQSTTNERICKVLTLI